MSGLILAHIIKNKAAARPDFDVLRFISPAGKGGWHEDARSYQSLWENGQKVAAGLESENMQPGDVFALLMANHAEFADAMVGSSIAATVFVPIDPRTAGDRLAYMLDFVKCKGVVVADYALGNLIAALPQLSTLEWIWVLGDKIPSDLDLQGHRFRNINEIMSADYAEIEIKSTDPLAPMQMFYTSGTTGDPKAILSSHARFSGVGALGPAIGFRKDDILYTGLSLTHANAQLITVGNAIVQEIRAIISLKFTKTGLWETLAHYNCTSFNLLGGMTTAIFAEPPGPFDRAHNVRFVFSAGMPTAMWRDFEERFNVEVFEFYGAAEGGLTMNPPGEGPTGSIGKAPPGTVCAILDNDDHECAPGDFGEICFRNEDGPVAPVSYYRNDEASAAKTDGGWFRSGDIGRKDEDGWVYFAYRAGGSVRRNGDFIDTARIEAVIAAVENVEDIYVYGVQTPENAPGEKEVVVAIVWRNGNGAASKDVFRICAEKLGKNTVPNFIQFVDKIPKTASEKPIERKLKAMLTSPGASVFAPSGETILELAEGH